MVPKRVVIINIIKTKTVCIYHIYLCLLNLYKTLNMLITVVNKQVIFACVRLVPIKN